MARKTRNTLQADFDDSRAGSSDIAPTITLARKTNRLTVKCDFEGIPCSFSLSVGDLEATFQRLLVIPPHRRGSLDAQLFAALIEASIRIKNPKGFYGARGIQAGRESFLLKVKYAAAWLYAFIRHEDCKPEQDRHPTLCRAKADLRRKEKWDSKASSRNRCVILTAWLVENTYGKERRQHGLQNPFAAQDFNYESFYETYIRPDSKLVRAQTKRSPNTLSLAANGLLHPLLTNQD